MYQYESKDYAAEFFKNQEDIQNSQTNRKIANAQEMRAQSLFSRNEEVQAITDKTLQKLGALGRGESVGAEAAIEDLAKDALSDKPKKGMGFNDNPVTTSPLDDAIGSGLMIDEKPRSLKLEPIDLTLGKMVDKVGEALMKAGYGAEGMAYVKEGIEYTKNLSEAEQKRAEAQIKKAESFIKVSDFVYEGLADVQSQEQQDNFFGNLPDSIVEILGIDNVVKMASMPYSPEVIDHYRQQALTTKETYDLNRLAESQQMQADRDAAAALNRQALTRIAEQRRIDAVRAREAKEKGAGKNAVLVVQPAALNQASTKIVADVFKGVRPKKGSPEETLLESAAGTIASEAMQMAKDNPGLTYDQALERSVTLHRGDFIQPEVEVPMVKTFLGKKVPFTEYTEKKKGPKQFVPRGVSKERPVILKSREEAGKMVPGKWYSYGGKTMQYNPD